MRRKRPFSLRVYLILMVLAILAALYLSSELLLALLSRLLDRPVFLPESLSRIAFGLILAGAITVLLNKLILTPVTRLGRGMGEVAAGDFAVHLETNSRIQEVQELYRDFNLMARELASTEVLQTDFVSNVSHEFKTPLGAIDGYATLLQDDPMLSEEQAGYVEKILFNARRLSGLTGNILLLSKLANQAIPIKREPYRLDEQIRQAIVSLEPKWSEKRLEFDADLDQTSFPGNEALLFHVWLNLIDNAVKFSPSGGVIEVRLQNSERNILFSISDSGPGISPHDRTRIFDRFYQADSSHREDGNGLGLPLAKQIAALHGGGIDVENRPQGGCKFTVVLPVK